MRRALTLHRRRLHDSLIQGYEAIHMIPARTGSMAGKGRYCPWRAMKIPVGSRQGSVSLSASTISIPTKPIGSIPRPVDLLERVAKGDSEDPEVESSL
jgi:hypothetical protein